MPSGVGSTHVLQTVVHAKSDEERAVIKQILSQNMLFKDLTPEAMNSVIDAMECKKFEAGDQPITQGTR